MITFNVVEQNDAYVTRVGRILFYTYIILHHHYSHIKSERMK